MTSVAAAFGVAPAATNLADMGSVVGHQGVYIFAFLFQFIRPPAFPFGAVASFIKRVRGGHLLDTSLPQCPECGAEMAERIAKQGKFAGKAFWGCRQYPKCRATTGESAKAKDDIFARGSRAEGSGWAGRRQK